MPFGRSRAKPIRQTPTMLLELRDPDSIPSQKILDGEEREIAFLQMDDLRRPSQAPAQCGKIRISGDDGIGFGQCPYPNHFIPRLFQSDVRHMPAHG